MVVRTALTFLSLVMLFGCGGGSPDGSHARNLVPPGGGQTPGNPNPGNNPSNASEFTFPTTNTGRYHEGITEYLSNRTTRKPSQNKRALIDWHVRLAQSRYDLIAGSRIAVVHPNTLADADILHTLLEAATPPPAMPAGRDQDMNFGSIHYHLRGAPYVYRDGEAYVDFANRRMGGGVMSRGFVQEEILLLETQFLPWVAALRSRRHPGLSFARNVSLKDLHHRPVVIKLRRFLEVAHLDEIYGRRLENVRGFNPARYLVDLPAPMDIYMPAMAAYDFKRLPEKTYTQARIAALTILATRAFYDTMLAQARDGKPLAIHTGNWGCGAFGNNHRTIWTIQRVAIEAAYRMFQQTTGLSPTVNYYYDAFDAAGVVEANLACMAFSAFPARMTLEEATHRIHHLTQNDSGWQARP